MKTNTHPLTYFTIKEVAGIRKCSTDTVRRMIARGELKAYRFGRLIRIHPDDLAKALKPVTTAADLRGGEHVA